jgi:PAS domain S-box-containing protein
MAATNPVHARVPFIYAAAGSAWVVVTSLAIPWFEGAPLSLAFPEVLKGLVFIALSTVFLRALWGPNGARAPSLGAPVAGSLARQLSVLALGTAGAGLLGYLLGHFDEQPGTADHPPVPLAGPSHGLIYGLLLGACVSVLGALLLVLWRARLEALGAAATLSESARRVAEQDRDRWERLVLDLPGLGVALTSVETDQIVYVNEELARMNERPRSELVGTPWQALAAAEHLAGLEEAKRRLASGELERLEIELTSTRREGGPRTFALHLHAVRGAQGVDHLAAFFIDITTQKAAERERDAAATRVHAALLATIDAIGRIIEGRDPYTAGHQHRVSRLAEAIGTVLELEPRRLEGLRLAGMMHDVGKITCPAEILVKPARLSPPELAIARTHPEEGAKILDGLDLPWPLAEIIHQHHEYLDGTGYPRGLKGDDILLEARGIRVASAFVALTSHRPYRPAISASAALEMLEAHRGTRYDVAVVDACTLLVRERGYRIDERPAR